LALGAAPNSVEAPENSLAFDSTWAWTSMPTMTSQSPVAPGMKRFGSGVRVSTMAIRGKGLRLFNRPRYWKAPRVTSRKTAGHLPADRLTAEASYGAWMSNYLGTR